MAYFLAKTDPDTYSITDFAAEQETVWNGVRNAQAVQALKAMRPKDDVLIYHSQGQSAIVGLAQVTANLGADPTDAKSWLVRLKFIRSFAEPYITLGDIKSSGLFDDFVLVRQSRLSTMAVPDTFVHWLKQQGLRLG